jgi:hypothetical protein
MLNENPDYSAFVGYIKDNNLDSLFKSEKSLTVFVPSNAAFEVFLTDSTDIEVLLKYHLVENVLNINDIKEPRIIETLVKKFALIERDASQFYIDGIEIVYASPLCKDGRFYETAEVLQPKPTIYEYVSFHSIIFKNYIDQFDSINMDYNKSKPLGFDDQGNTIYDSVFTIINTFSEDFFPVNTEFRKKRATLVIFDEEQYNSALNEMADVLGDQYADYRDIPEDWQYNDLLPFTISNGIFAGSFEYSDFLKGRLKNIAGDSVDVDFNNIDSESRFLCSNGVVFKYNNYSIPQELYMQEKRIQGEDLVVALGTGIYGWREDVKVSGSNRSPEKSYFKLADNDTLISVSLGNNYLDAFMLEFIIPRVFPMRYRLEWRALNRPSGYFEIYVNDEIVGYFDLYDMRKVQYSVSGDIFIPEDGINSIDFSVDNITTFGEVKIGLKYFDGGVTSSNGLSIDYISLIPY